MKRCVFMRPGRAARRGMTLLEVMVGIAILGILAVLLVGALFYPRYLSVTSALEQSAIHAANAEIERHLYSTNPPAAYTANATAGWNLLITNVTTAISSPTGLPPGTLPSLRRVDVTVQYRDGNSVSFVTYRLYSNRLDAQKRRTL